MPDNYFKLSEFCITSDAIPQAIADKILKNFIVPLNIIRAEIGKPIIVSQKAGYRPKAYELSKGRSGGSQHTFEGMGAADLTCSEIVRFAHLLQKHTPFTRICYYYNNRFFHVDYKHSGPDKQLFLCASPTRKWVYVNNRDFITYVEGSMMPDVKLVEPK